MDPRLHPRLLASLQQQGWTGLTPAQEAALTPLMEGSHVLLVAPTGHGKTEAAWIPVLSRMLVEHDRLASAGRPWPTGFKALYITPLRALNRDLLGRLETWAGGLGITVGVRHGDTTPAERSRQARRPPDILITTPESLQLLLFGDTLRRHLATVRFVVVDEVHDLAASERGAQLMVALERLEEVIGQPAAVRAAKARERPGPTAPSARPGGGFQRIALSATVAAPAALAQWLAGEARAMETVEVRAQKEWHLRVVHPMPDAEDARAAARLSLPPAVVAQLRAVRRLATTHDRVLVFHNTRDGAEVMVSRSAVLDAEDGQPPLLELHHGSLSAEHRTDVERRFKCGDVRALVATSSLELGIDIGAIDHVVQVQSPHSAVRLVQRLGRAGHRIDAISAGTLVASGAEDALECLAVALLAQARRLEPLRMRHAPLAVLSNQLVALTNEYRGLDRGWTRAVIGRAGPFADMDDDLFDAVWQALLDLGTLFADQDAPGRLGRSGRARRHFLDHVSLIPDEKRYRVLDEASKRTVGTVDDASVAAGLRPGALFVMAGRSWQVLEVDVEEERIRVAPAKELGAVPQWAGQQIPVRREVAEEAARLRRVLGKQGDDTDRADDGARDMADDPGPVLDLLDDDARAAVVAPLRQQREAGLVIPHDRNVVLERARRQWTLHAPLGTRGNEALGRITQALLHQRLGAPVGMDCDAYRIHLTVPADVRADVLLDLWRGLDPEALDVLMALVVRDSPVLRRHAVQVAKEFGGLPKDLDPNRTTRDRIAALLAHPALHEEAIGRLLWDRMDLEAAADWLRRLPDADVVVQAVGPIAALGSDGTRRLVAPPRTDESLLRVVRDRIEGAEVLMVCTQCRHSWPATVHLLPRRIRCRRCQSIDVACLRPWNEEAVALLGKKGPEGDDAREQARLRRNGALVAGFGAVACRALVARGVGPDTAARILQKSADPEDPTFWREVLLAELQFARTSPFWGR